MPHKPRPLPAAIAREQEIIHRIAADYGLDFYETIFEMVDFQQMNEIAAYMGFPTRYPHWRWGMEYERMRKSYTYGLHKIYEMVINNDPCYAYLLESNELIDQKIVIAHVYGHCLAPETQVLTAEGVKPITEVRGGDKLLTHTGAYRPVRVTARRWFDGEIYKLSVTGSAEPIRITGEHPVLLLRPSRRTLPHWQPLSHTPLHGGSAPPPHDGYEMQWVRASEVQAGDWVAQPRRQQVQAVAGATPVAAAQLEPLVAQLAEVLVGDARAGFQGVGLVAEGALGEGWADERYEYLPVRSVRTEPYQGFVYNFSVEEDESYTLAAGMVVHNCDFFKNNLWFGKTSRKMMDEMANHATRVWRIIERIGMTEVEEFIDTCLSLENLIDRHAPYREQPKAAGEPDGDVEVDIRRPTAPKLRVGRDYMDSFINPPELLRAEAEQRSEELRARTVRFPDEAQRDVLRFLLDHAPLERWQRDILEIVRKEAYYFAPQGMTKVGNEGWATFWHTEIMTQSGVMTDAEVVDYADHHSGTVAMSPQRMNPYKIGLELLRDIEERWNRGQFGKEWDECDDARERRAWDKKLGLGREKIFEVRRVYNDIGLIDTFFTEDFCNRHQLFTYHFNERTGRYEITSREFQAVKKQLLFSLTNFGQPTVVVEDGNFENRGALLLEHRYEGIELKLDEARDTLKNLFALWKRPIYLRTIIDETPRLLSFDGKEHATKRIR